LAKVEKVGKSGRIRIFQTKELDARHAWQFTKPLTVKIISFEPQKNQAKVELLTPGPVSGEYMVDRWKCFCEIEATDCADREAITMVPRDSRPDARQNPKA
jgi:hypothetical protein